MKLSTPMIDEFQQSGKIVVPSFFSSREVLAMQKEVDRWMHEGFFRDVSTNPAIQNLQCIPLNPISPLFRSLAHTPMVVNAIEALIGSPALKILDQCFYKPARSGMATSWHTDNAYFQMSNPLAGVAMWIAIHDADKTNGCLRVIPNAYHEEFPHRRDLDSDHHIRTTVDMAQAHYCELSAGGVVFFCFGTPHATGSNPTTSPRAGVGIHYVNMSKMDGLKVEKWQQIQQTQSASAVAEGEKFETLVDDLAGPDVS